MKTRRLVIACPECGSEDISYSCTPSCCFNHVCGNCYTTFEPVTEMTGETVSGVEPPDPLPEAADPAVACDKCESTEVYMADGDKLVCAACGSVLTLELTEVAPG